MPDLPAERYPEFVAHYRKHFLAREDAMQLFDGMRELLSELSEDARCSPSRPARAAAGSTARSRPAT